MVKEAQTRATAIYRARLAERGVVRAQISAPAEDIDLLRTLARKLIEKDPASETLRCTLKAAVGERPAVKGHILAALRRSPLVGADLDFARGRPPARKADL